MGLFRKTAIELADGVRSGEFSAEEVASHFLSRVQGFDSETGAFLEVFEESVMEQAKAVDRKRREGGTLGKLAGVPIGIKDNIHIRGKNTTCASKILENYKAVFSASVIDMLEREDALLIGKTNMDEFAMGSTTANSAFRTTCNPWDLDRVPGGSSGGSAAAVSARFCPLSLGSDTGGSIRQPASFCGVVGFKPSYGRVSRYGLVAFASSLDQIGPIGTTVEDVALGMEVLGQCDERDATWSGKSMDNCLMAVKQAQPPKVIGVPSEFLEGLDKEVRDNFFAALAVFENLGTKIIEVNLNILRYSIAGYYVVASAEASTNLARFDGIRYGYRDPDAKTLSEVYTMTRGKGFGKEVIKRILLGTFVLSASQKKAYYETATMIRQAILRAFNKAFCNCDFVALPVCPGPAFKHNEVLDDLRLYLQDYYTVGVNLAYLPAIAIPSGFTSEGLPLGIQLIGPRDSDVNVCGAAYVYQESSGIKNKIPGMFDIV
ncbi:MAG: Asp-tRNA(Asn)/Glu-tRNA(Gln) amidotransferase subunit GatA [Victivallaceae bacterium]